MIGTIFKGHYSRKKIIRNSHIALAATEILMNNKLFTPRMCDKVNILSKFHVSIITEILKTLSVSSFYSPCYFMFTVDLYLRQDILLHID